MSFLPTLDVLLTYGAACVVLTLTPGPDMVLYLGQTLQAGRERGFAAMSGVYTGLIAHCLLAAFGLSALLLASAAAFTAVKIAGAIYLAWLAFQTIRHGTMFTVKTGARTRRPLHEIYLMGVGVNLLNPKVVIFFLTFLPQFVSPSDPHAPAKLFFLGIFFIVISLPLCAGLILAAERFTGAMRRSSRIMRTLDWLFAGLMGVFALRLLLARGD